MFSKGERFPFLVIWTGIGKWISMALIVMMVTPEVIAQDPHFTQFYANKLYLNPAFAGTNRCPRVALNFRDQWTNLTGTFVTYSASYDRHVRDVGGLGIMFSSDNQAGGTFRTNTIHGQYAWIKPINRKVSISLGGEVSYRNRVLDWSKLSFGDQIDPKWGHIHPTAEQNKSVPSNVIDFSAGGLLYGKKFFVGFAAHHLTTPIEAVTVGSENELSMRYTVHGGMQINPRNPRGKNQDTNPNDVRLSPNIIYMRQGEATEINLGMYVRKGAFVGGLWYRSQDAFIMLTGFHLEHMKIGYSYDFSVSELSNSGSGGSHEVTLQYLIPCKEKGPRWRPPDCPSF